MQRAAIRARAVAASTNTPIHFIKDGRIVAIMPGAATSPAPSPTTADQGADKSSDRHAGNMYA